MSSIYYAKTASMACNGYYFIPNKSETGNRGLLNTNYTNCHGLCLTDKLRQTTSPRLALSRDCLMTVRDVLWKMLLN